MTAPNRCIPNGRRVQRLIDRYKAREGNSCGGSLHIVTDDGNFCDGSVQFCEEYALKNGDHTGARLARVILLLTMTQRRKWV